MTKPSFLVYLNALRRRRILDFRHGTEFHETNKFDGSKKLGTTICWLKCGAAWHCWNMSSTLVLPPSTLEAQLLERHLLRMGSGQALGPPPITGDEIARILRCNLVQEFERLRGVPGFQLDPVPWETTRKLVEENTAESLGKLGRSPAGSVIYWKFKGTVNPLLPKYD